MNDTKKETFKPARPLHGEERLDSPEEIREELDRDLLEATLSGELEGNRREALEAAGAVLSARLRTDCMMEEILFGRHQRAVGAESTEKGKSRRDSAALLATGLAAKSTGKDLADRHTSIKESAAALAAIHSALEEGRQG